MLSEEDKETLKKYMSEKNLPWQILKRLEAIRLLSKGLSQTLVAKQLCVRREIVYEYKKAFEQGGILALLKMEKPGRETTLTEEMLRAVEQYRHSLKKKHVAHKVLADFLQIHYGVAISPEWLAKRLMQRKYAQKSEPWK